MLSAEIVKVVKYKIWIIDFIQIIRRNVIVSF